MSHVGEYIAGSTPGTFPLYFFEKIEARPLSFVLRRNLKMSKIWIRIQRWFLSAIIRHLRRKQYKLEQRSSLDAADYDFIWRAALKNENVLILMLLREICTRKREELRVSLKIDPQIRRRNLK